jgi:AcrR family transcriptional regulator
MRVIRRKERETEIIQAAARVFAQRGFVGTLMADIATEAGIGKGTVYEYFDSKEDLFFAVFEWFTQKTAANASVRVSALSGSAAERLKAFVEAIISAGAEMEDLFSLSMEFWAAASSSRMRSRFVDAFRAVYRDFRQIVSALIRDGIERGEFRRDVDPDAVAAGLVGGFDGLLLQAWFDESFDPMRASRHFVADLIQGLSLTGETSPVTRHKGDKNHADSFR